MSSHACLAVPRPATGIGPASTPLPVARPAQQRRAWPHLDSLARVQAVVNRFLDFNRSLSSQETVCERIACYTLASYLLDASHVTGYLWPNGGSGSGKTTLLNVVASLGYLGEVILASSSNAAQRDLADCGAVLAFDDAEAIMDIKRCEPDKRTLPLAGNRRGAYVTLKEKAEGDRWVTRHVNAYCPRLLSAIRLPDEVLGSRTIIVPLVRSVRRRGAHQGERARLRDLALRSPAAG
jgi:hypothetical protein